MMTSKHRFTLDPGSKKFLCPSCQKKRFVRYVNIETKAYHPDGTFGRCDRLNCNHFKPVPVGTKAYRFDFILSRSISDKAIKLTTSDFTVQIIPKSVILEMGNKYAYVAEWFLLANSLEITGEPKFFGDSLNTLIEVKETEPLEPSYYPIEYLNDSVPDNLTSWLLKRFPAKDVAKAAALYNLTGVNNPWQASTVFWQIDLENRIRGGKILNYDPATGKRVKLPYPRISWIHSILKDPDFNLVQCLYGLHLVKHQPYAEIGIVESEKSAIYMSIVQPEKAWLSCGSVSGLKPGLLSDIKDRKITAYPDKGCFIDWNAKAKAMNADGFNISVGNLLESIEELPDGSDLVDYYELNTNTKNEI